MVKPGDAAKGDDARKARARVGRFALAGAAALALVAAPARAEGEAGAGPCDDLVTYLRGALAGPAPVVPERREWDYRLWESRLEEGLRSTSPTMPAAYASRVTPACRAETRRGVAQAATAAARAWTQRREPGWIDRGRILLCTMQDPASLSELTAWMTDVGKDHPYARAVCASELATWPGAEPLRRSVLARAIQKVGVDWWGRWEIDPAVVAGASAIGTPELREQLVPVLADAHAHRALGYDRLRDAVCTNDGSMSGDRARRCSPLPTEAEDGWRRSDRTNRWLGRGAATAVYAGAITAAFVERDHEAGRAIATTAAVPIGALTGMTVLGVLAAGAVRPSGRSTSIGAKILLASGLIAGAIAGGVLGGLVAHDLAASPGARAPVIAVALAPIYLTAVIMTLDLP
jgi:hypothetical protein